MDVNGCLFPVKWSTHRVLTHPQKVGRGVIRRVEQEDRPALMRAFSGPPGRIGFIGFDTYNCWIYMIYGYLWSIYGGNMWKHVETKITWGYSYGGNMRTPSL